MRSVRKSKAEPNYTALIDAIGEVHRGCQARAATAVNQSLTLRNWLIGAYIVEYEQRGSDRAKYGDKLMERLAKDLTGGLGRGFGIRMLRDMRRFYLDYPQVDALIRQSVIADLPSRISNDFSETTSAIRQSPIAELPAQRRIPRNAADSLIAQSPIAQSALHPEHFYIDLLQRLTWTHILEFLRLDDPLKRAFYEIEAVKNKWSVREMKRQMDSLLFERVGLSKDKQGMLQLAKQGQLIIRPADLFKDPYVLEFTGLADRPHYVESDLESALLDHLQAFLLELGQGFCFEARQQRITVGTDHDYIDLVFYHRVLRCHVLIDLKIRKFRPADAGQMNFYLNYFRKHVATGGDSPPVGLILCTNRDRVHVEYATAGLDNQVFVSRYLVTLPSVEQLERFLEEERDKLTKILPAKKQPRRWTQQKAVKKVQKH